MSWSLQQVISTARAACRTGTVVETGQQAVCGYSCSGIMGECRAESGGCGQTAKGRIAYRYRVWGMTPPFRIQVAAEARCSCLSSGLGFLIFQGSSVGQMTRTIASRQRRRQLGLSISGR